MLQAVAARSPEEVAAALQRVLAETEIRREPGLFEQAFQWILERLGQLDGPSGSAVEYAALLAAGVAIAFLVVLCLRLLRRAQRRPAPEKAQAAAVRTRVAELRAAARSARQAGDDALALRLLLFALVAGLGQRGDLRYRDAWTNRELVQRGEPSREVSALLGPLIDELEGKEFGRVPVTGADVDRLAELCDRWLGAEEAA